MANFSPHTPYTVPFYIHVPDGIKNVKGVSVKTYTKNETLFFGSFRTFGGTETTSNGTVAVENTGTLETWFDPTIKSDCQIEIDSTLYEILGTPENINMRNQYLVIRLRAVKGGV